MQEAEGGEGGGEGGGEEGGVEDGREGEEMQERGELGGGVGWAGEGGGGGRHGGGERLRGRRKDKGGFGLRFGSWRGNVKDCFDDDVLQDAAMSRAGYACVVGINHGCVRVSTPLPRLSQCRMNMRTLHCCAQERRILQD